MENGNTARSVPQSWNWPTFGHSRGFCSFNYKRSTIAHFWIPNWQISQTKFLCNFSRTLNEQKLKCIKWRRNYTRENKIISDRRTFLILQGFLPFEICMGPVTGHAYSGVWSVSRYGPYLLFSSPGSMSRSSWYASPHCQSKKHFSFTFAFHGHSWYFTSSQP